jgi:hypothetical protein
MKTFITATILALCTSAAFSATAPSADQCVSEGHYGNWRMLNNSCSRTIEIAFAFSDGRTGTTFAPAGAGGHIEDNLVGAAQHPVKWFACYMDDAVLPSASPESFIQPDYDTAEYWCFKP